MNVEEFKEVVAKLKGHSGRLAISCEFEPLLHPSVETMLQLTAELSKGWQIRLNTNGILLSESVSRAIVESGISEIYVSLDAPTPELNARLRGNAAFPRIVLELKKFAAMKAELGRVAPSCIIRSTVMRANLEQLPGMIELAAEVGAERFAAKHIVPIAGCEWEGHPMEQQSCLLDPERTSVVFDRIRQRGRELGIGTDLPHAAPRPDSELRISCGYVTAGFHIFPDGTCFPCVWMTAAQAYGSIFGDTVEAVLNSQGCARLKTAFLAATPPSNCLACLSDSQTIGLKATNDARARLEATHS